jgi:hypothetical protein
MKFLISSLYHCLPHSIFLHICDARLWYLTNSMEQSSSWEANSRLARQHFSQFSWNAKVHYHSHKSPPLNPVPSRITPVNIHALNSFQVYFNIILPSTFRSPKLPSISSVDALYKHCDDPSCSITAENFWIGWITISCSRKTLYRWGSLRYFLWREIDGYTYEFVLKWHGQASWNFSGG